MTKKFKKEIFIKIEKEEENVYLFDQFKTFYQQDTLIYSKVKNQEQSDALYIQSIKPDKCPTPYFQIDHIIDFNLQNHMPSENLDKKSKVLDEKSKII